VSRDIAIGAGLAVAIFLVAHDPGLLPVLLMVGLAVVLLRMVGGLPQLRPRFASLRQARTAPAGAVTFEDVGGQEAAKQELQEALEFLRQPERVRRMGIRPLKGILLTGPPGTGKTLLAKAAATHTGSVFIASSGSEFIEVYAGVGAQRVRDLFRRAREEGRRQNAPAIVFIDELEVIGGKRGRHQSHLEYDQTLNQLLVEMDGMGSDDAGRLLVIAATNRPDLLDDALTRPGRFDRIVRVDLPDREGRLQILGLHTRGKPLAPDVDLDRVARATFGFSGAHLESLSNEAAILAMRAGCDTIPERFLHEAVDKVLLGEKLDRRPNRDEQRRIAVHEAGHALVGELLDPGSVARVTVTARGQALGFVRQQPQEDFYLYTQERLEVEIQRLLAGSLAEEVLLGDRSTGARNDFEQVLRLTETMVASGMSSLGVVDPEALPDGALQREQSVIIARMEQRVRQLLAARQDALEAVATVLLEEEAIPGERLRQLLQTPGEQALAAVAAPAVDDGEDGTDEALARRPEGLARDGRQAAEVGAKAPGGARGAALGAASTGIPGDGRLRQGA
jgi:vesicle-fusing ATPase